ncbi:MAG: NAD(+) kinase [Pseudomonadota bacterium]|nr:NAD(+) kinase [Pseudomonadota bacterium]
MFSRIGITGKTTDTEIGSLLRPLFDHLAPRVNQLILDERLTEFLPGHAVASLKTIAASSDLVIIIGGDGTLLHSARILAPYNVPVVGINRGRLGFLADIASERMLQSLDRILEGQYSEDPRFLLHSEIIDADGISLESSLALNDVVIHKWLSARMIEFEIWINDSFVETQRSDGIIVSTPTGSTAYALSGGGPLVYPDLNAILLVPICPHTLSNRPIMLRSDSTIRFRMCERTASENVRITCDGQTTLEISHQDQLVISRSEHNVRLLHPAGHDHFQILRNKLNWGHRT